MSSNDRIRRLVRLLELFQYGRSYNSAELSELCSVSRRTTFRDIRTLQDSGIPVRFDESLQGYRLLDSMYLPPTDLTISEALSLLVLTQSLGRETSGIPFQRASQSAARKLLSLLPRHLAEHVGELSNAVTMEITPHNRLDRAEETYDVITESIQKRRCVRIEYDSFFDQGVITTLLSPYRLHFSRRSWYVIGRSSVHRSVRTFNLGRVHSTTTTNNPYEIPQRFSLDRFFGNAWSMIPEQREYDVVIRFQPMVARNIAEVQWHKTQRIEWSDDDTLLFHATVDGLGEISWWILGYGNQAEVLEPPELRDRIRQHVDELRQIYVND